MVQAYWMGNEGLGNVDGGWARFQRFVGAA